MPSPRRTASALVISLSASVAVGCSSQTSRVADLGAIDHPGGDRALDVRSADVRPDVAADAGARDRAAGDLPTDLLAPADRPAPPDATADLPVVPDRSNADATLPADGTLLDLPPLPDAAPPPPDVLVDRPAVPRLRGRVTLGANPLPAGMSGWILLYDTPLHTPAPGPPPHGAFPIANDGSFSIPLAEGDYYVYGVLDVDGEMGPSFRPGAGDLAGVPAANPVHVGQSGATVEVPIPPAQGTVASMLAGGPDGSSRLDLYQVSVRVVNPLTGALVADATVTLSDGTRSFALSYEPGKGMYRLAGTRPSAWDGAYNFRVSHPTIYQPPLLFTIQHHPMTARPHLIQPTSGQSFTLGAAITVSWTPAAGEERSGVITCQQECGPGHDPLWMGPGPSPVTIPAAAFSVAGDYAVEVQGHRTEVQLPAGFSYPSSLDFARIRMVNP